MRGKIERERMRMGNKREREREREGYWERKQWKSESVNVCVREREKEGDSESKWDRQTDRQTEWDRNDQHNDITSPYLHYQKILFLSTVHVHYLLIRRSMEFDCESIFSHLFLLLRYFFYLSIYLLIR